MAINYHFYVSISLLLDERSMQRFIVLKDTALLANYHFPIVTIMSTINYLLN